MNTNDRTRAELLAIMDEIERLQRALGGPVSDPQDRDAFDTVCRIERTARARTAATEPAE